ncbi:MAG: hypothetical protein NTW79_03800 [Candidatus Berkelbacteria bacterium]|nr:hypothetical protein [Candidatus Berkelbacteria bacterium]
MNKNKAKLFFLFTLTVFALATFVLTIFNYNPYSSDGSVFAIFYLSIFFSLTGIIATILIFIRSRFSDISNLSDFFSSSIRQAAIASLIIIVLLFLQGLKILDLWVGVPLTVAIILVELFFHSKNKKI